MEAEIIAASEGAKEAVWYQKISADLSESPAIPVLHCDNEAAVDWYQDVGKYHGKAKHIELRYFYVRNDLIAQDRLRIQHIPGKEQPADALTKQLSAQLMEKHSKTMGLDIARYSIKG